MIVVGAVLAGLVLGPLLGVLIDRIYEKDSFELGHRCQICHAPRSGRSGWPVLGWFSSCTSDPSHPRWRYGLMDLFTAVSFGLLAFVLGASWQLIPYLGVFAVLAALAEFDLETHLLPDRIIWPIMGITLFLVLVLSGSNGADDRIVPAMVGALFFGLAFLTLYIMARFVFPDGLGFGDVKLAPTLGALLGWQATTVPGAMTLVIWTIMVASLSTALVGLALKYGPWSPAPGPAPTWLELFDDEEADSELYGAEIPMGPFLVASTLLMIVVGGQLLP